MTDKLDEYSDILLRLVSETVACSPREWSKGALTIDSDGTRIDYKLKNEDYSSKAQISEKLRDLIDEFYVRMSRRGEIWTQAVVSFRRENGEVKFDTAFTYPKAVTKPDLLAKKQWWKFGRA